MSNVGDRGSGIGDRGAGLGLPAEARSAKVGDRDRFDTAIELAVREMLEVEPQPGLRSRVLDRIDPKSVASAFRRKDTFRRKIVWGTVPLAAAAAIILAVLAPWPSAAPPAVTSVTPSIARVDPPPAVATPPPSPKTAGSAHPGTTRTIPLPRSTPPLERQPSRRAVEDGMVVAAVAPDDNATVIDPLAPITPIVAAGTHPQPIAPKDIAVSPMAPIAQLQMAPLSPPERRN